VKFEIYNLINKLVEQGIGVVVISSELPELIGISDRIAVMCEGRITGELMKEEFSQEKILKLATQTLEKTYAD
jgi:ABC-type sugar transport system ATPase subunit